MYLNISIKEMPMNLDPNSWAFLRHCLQKAGVYKEKGWRYYISDRISKHCSQGENSTLTRGPNIQDFYIESCFPVPSETTY